MRKVNLKYTGAKTSEELGSAMVPESTLIVKGTIPANRTVLKPMRTKVPHTR